MKKFLFLAILMGLATMGANAQKLIKKDTIIEKEDKDGNKYQWLRYNYVLGEDTLQAAFDLNGKRITPNGYKSKKGYNGAYYLGGDLFVVATKQWFNNCDVYNALYNSKGVCIIPDTKDFTSFFYGGDGVIIANTRGTCPGDGYVHNYYYAAYNTEGKCIVSELAGYTWVGYYPEHKTIWCVDKSENKFTYTPDGKYFAAGAYSSIDGSYDPKDGYFLDKPEDLALFNKHKRLASTNSVSTNKKQSSSSSNNNPSGLLYKGEYTWGAQARVNGNLISGGMNQTATIEIYEDYLGSETGWGLSRHNYKGTNANGERIYKGTYGFGDESTVFVSPSYGIRMVVHSVNQWGNNYTEYKFTKGKSFMYEYENAPDPRPDPKPKPKPDPNPVQPHQVTKDCPSCLGSGKCSTCNGKHQYKAMGSSSYITCPNCKPNGACSSCGGSGKKTSTKYY